MYVGMDSKVKNKFNTEIQYYEKQHINAVNKWQHSQKIITNHTKTWNNSWFSVNNLKKHIEHRQKVTKKVELLFAKNFKIIQVKYNHDYKLLSFMAKS